MEGSNKKIRIMLVSAFFISMFMPSSALAVHATFKQQIVPMNCVFQQVNDGTGTIIYLTPKECGVIVNPPPGSKPSLAEQQVQQQFNPNRAIFFVTMPKNKSNKNTNKGQILQPIATIPNGGISQSYTNNPIHGWVVAGLTTLVLALILLLIALLRRRRHKEKVDVN